MIECGIIVFVMLAVIIGLSYWIEWLSPVFEEKDNDK